MEHDLGHFRGKKILITGGGGYLGSKLAEWLRLSDATITLSDISFNHISESLIENNHNINKCYADITRKNEIEKVCKEINPDYIYHFCALLYRERDFRYYADLYNVNVNGTLNLLEALKFINYSGLFFSSSSEVYGSKNPSPFHEQQIPMPASPYSLTKFMAEKIIQTYSEIHNKPYTILRIFNFFGSDMPEKFFINQLVASLLNNNFFEMTAGEQTRDFLHIDQLTAIIAELGKSVNVNGEILNICSGKKIMLKELAMEIGANLGKTHLLKIGALPYRKNEIWEMTGSNEKLKGFIHNSFLNKMPLITSHFA